MLREGSDSLAPRARNDNRVFRLGSGFQDVPADGSLAAEVALTNRPSRRQRSSTRSIVPEYSCEVPLISASEYSSQVVSSVKTRCSSTLGCLPLETTTPAMVLPTRLGNAATLSTFSTPGCF